MSGKTEVQIKEERERLWLFQATDKEETNQIFLAWNTDGDVAMSYS